MKYWDFQITEKIRRGYFSATYFNRTKKILEGENNRNVAVMQLFQKNEGSVMCGVEEVIELFRIGAGYWEGEEWVSKFDEIKIESLTDGDELHSGESVMHITGPYVYFAHLESLYLGILARRTLVASNTKRAVNAAGGKPVIFFADRFDHFFNQEGDGYAAHIGGAAGVCTQAHTAWWNGIASGTIPHSLIAMNGGNTIKAAELFIKYNKDVNLIVLVDFENDCVKTSVEAAKALGEDLWGVRLDTAQNMIDKSLENQGSGIRNQELYGVNPILVKNVREALDKEGFNNVKIVVSGGFNAERIKRFEEEKVSVDVYGVGSSLVHGQNDFTADIVTMDWKRIAKTGREFRDNPRFKLVKP
ncbi:MAG: nicotinate phosphoribosyltransferase [Patescibacteria group bacterium]|nr:nicotinate phosphoribosyltransferase [Patescibacteria group bacterium]